MILKLLLFLTIIDLYLAIDVCENLNIKEKIITQTYYGYHHLKAISTRQTIKVVYAPDTTPHAYPSWPHNHIYGRDTLFSSSDYYYSSKHSDYKKNNYYPVHIKVKKDTLLQFVEQVDEFKTDYKKDGRKSSELLKVTNYEHLNRYNKDTGIGMIINKISTKTSTKSKRYRYDNSPGYDFYINDKNDPKYEIYYPFPPIKDSTLKSIRYEFNLDGIGCSPNEVSYRYGFSNVEGKSKSFITQIKHSKKSNDYSICDIPRSKNHSFESKFKIPRSIPSGLTEACLYEGFCTPDSLSFFTDSLGRTVKRKTFYVYDDCSYGGYATTDSIFNSQGQLIIEKPGYHSNGTTMGPPYTIKEFKYHDNGHIAEIISDGNTARTVYNENGQILIKEYLGSENTKDIYEYDEHGNLILFIFIFDFGSDESYKVKYEHIYNDKDLLIESYIYYQPNPKYNLNFTTQLVDDNNLDKYLISKYEYDQYNQLIKKEEYKEGRWSRIPNLNLAELCPEFNADSCIHYGLLYKLTTYGYKYFEY